MQSNAPEKYGFFYEPQQDAFICLEGEVLTYHRLNCNKSTGKHLRKYQAKERDCPQLCPKCANCFNRISTRRRILACSCYPAFFRGHTRPEYLPIWCSYGRYGLKAVSPPWNGNTVFPKSEKGATEEYLLSAMALNLKRIVKAIFSELHFSQARTEHVILRPWFCFCQ